MISLKGTRHAAKDFKNFNPGVYLTEYYSEIQQEDYHHLLCLAKAYASVTGDVTLLEIGGGPTLYQLMSAAVKVREIHFSDYLESNLEEVKRWIDRSSDAFDWNRVTTVALLAEGIIPTVEAIEAREEMLRNKITKLIRCDAFQKYPISSDKSVVKYDIVSVHFVAESITDNCDEWKQVFTNICSCVKSGGKLVMATMKHCTTWQNGLQEFKATCVTEQDIVELLIENGFRLDETVMETFPASQESYREVIFFISTKHS